MLSNNFPVQRTFYHNHHGFLDLQEKVNFHDLAVPSIDPVEHKKKLRAFEGHQSASEKKSMIDDYEQSESERFRRKRLFYAFTSLLRGGNPDVLEDCTDLLLRSYAALRPAMSANEPPSLVPKLVRKKIIHFLATVSEMEIFHVTDVAKWNADRKKAEEEFQNWSLPELSEVPKMHWVVLFGEKVLLLYNAGQQFIFTEE